MAQSPTVSHSTEPTVRRRSTDSIPPWFAAVLVGVPTIFIAIVMAGILSGQQGSFASLFQFPDILRANTPTGADIGAHVLLPDLLKNLLVGSGSITGWSNDWFAGFPVLFFYFPLPALAIVVLDVFIPAGVAFKIVVVSGLVALPAAAFLFMRWLGFDRLLAAMSAMAAGVFVFMGSYWIQGGNIKSTLAGEFSFSWAFALSLLYLGRLERDVRENRQLEVWPAVLLALTAVAHVVPTMIVVAISLPLLFRRGGPRTVISSWVVGFGLAAFWALPFSINVLRGMVADMGWISVGGVVGQGTPIPAEIVPFIVFGGAGLIRVVARHKTATTLYGMALVPIVVYFLLPRLGATLVFNGRLLPYWYLSVFLFAGLAVGYAATGAVRLLRDRWNGAILAAVAGVLVLFVAMVISVRDVPFFVHWSFSGYEAKEGFESYMGLMDGVDELPPGRVMAESSIDMAEFGTPLALMLFPYWGREHPSMAGLYFESSLTTPFNFLNESEVSLEPVTKIPGLDYHSLDFDRAKRHLALFNVAYYVGYTAEAKAAARRSGLDAVAVAQPWVVFALPRSEPIDVASYEPTVWAGSADFTDAALEWYDDVERLDEWLTESGPTDWVRVGSVEDRASRRLVESDSLDAVVSNVQIDDQRIAFDTTAIGVPHLVKVSYFPNWRAQGADGPYRAAPSLMIVVPTEESVVITFERSWVENSGLALTVVSILGAGLWGIRRKRVGSVDRRLIDDESVRVG